MEHDKKEEKTISIEQQNHSRVEALAMCGKNGTRKKKKTPTSKNHLNMDVHKFIFGGVNIFVIYQTRP